MGLCVSVCMCFASCYLVVAFSTSPPRILQTICLDSLTSLVVFLNSNSKLVLSIQEEGAKGTEVSDCCPVQVKVRENMGNQGFPPIFLLTKTRTMLAFEAYYKKWKVHF